MIGPVIKNLECTYLTFPVSGYQVILYQFDQLVVTRHAAEKKTPDFDADYLHWRQETLLADQYLIKIFSLV